MIALYTLAMPLCNNPLLTFSPCPYLSLHFLSTSTPTAYSWGGMDCAGHLTPDIHLWEGVCWTALTLLLIPLLNLGGRLRRVADRVSAALAMAHAKRTWLDVGLGLTHVGLIAYQLWFKAQTRCMLIMLQPCHIIVALQGLALLARPTRFVGTALLLHVPWLPGCMMAMVLPDTGSLPVWLNVEMYWIEHVFAAIITPIYLFLRHRATLTHAFNFDALLLGVWTALPFHWPLMALVNYLTQVNVQFMLCPSAGLAELMDALELAPWMYPSYRTFITSLWVFMSALLALVYVGVFHALAAATGRRSTVAGAEAAKKRS